MRLGVVSCRLRAVDSCIFVDNVTWQRLICQQGLNIGLLITVCIYIQWFGIPSEISHKDFVASHFLGDFILNYHYFYTSWILTILSFFDVGRVSLSIVYCICLRKLLFPCFAHKTSLPRTDLWILCTNNAANSRNLLAKVPKCKSTKLFHSPMLLTHEVTSVERKTTNTLPPTFCPPNDFRKKKRWKHSFYYHLLAIEEESQYLCTWLDFAVGPHEHLHTNDANDNANSKDNWQFQEDVDCL